VIGIPGTGLSGVFYALLIVWMPIREAMRLRVHAAAGDRWRQITRLGSLLLGILLAFWAEGWALKQFFGSFPNAVQAADRTDARVAAIGALLPVLAVAAFMILATLIGLDHAIGRGVSLSAESNVCGPAAPRRRLL